MTGATALLPLLLGWSFGRVADRDPAMAVIAAQASTGVRADYIGLW
ncbi:MAG: hypothetical protein LH485_05155 [Sphingomonas bacterium]|nr:hypothetical protein [Sphingomonas bacterium]